MPPGFPLPPIDASGQALRPGDVVLIASIPEWLTHNLAAEDVAALRVLEGTYRAILRFDDYGYAWFGDREAQEWFCLKPEELRRCVD
jgi:hypothetical protein